MGTLSGANDFPEGAAVVLGGSGGLGSAIVERLACYGANVALTYRGNADAAEAAAEQARAHGVKVSSHRLDLGSIGGFFEDVRAKYGRIHTVVFAVGAAIEQPFISKVTPEQWRKVIEADANGFFEVVHASLPMLREHGGSYVLLSSAGLERYPAGDILSVAPKAAAEALMKGIAREEGRHGVRANSVAVGVIDAGMFPRLVETGHFSPEWVEAARRNAALRRFGTAREVAEAVAFLASSRATYVTGQRLLLDGGYSI